MPQHQTPPLAVTAQAELPPIASEVTRSPIPATRVGTVVEKYEFVFLPSRSFTLVPQHTTPPSSTTAHAEEQPTESALALSGLADPADLPHPATITGAMNTRGLTAADRAIRLQAIMPPSWTGIGSRHSLESR
jgi:hypothetical protein